MGKIIKSIGALIVLFIIILLIYNKNTVVEERVEVTDTNSDSYITGSVYVATETDDFSTYLPDFAWNYKF